MDHLLKDVLTHARIPMMVASGSMLSLHIVSGSPENVRADLNRFLERTPRTSYLLERLQAPSNFIARIHFRRPLLRNEIRDLALKHELHFRVH
ncbi:hypothetical protein KJ765_00555 [Candidatus Micrarchaeota archaeon]|nr:hypothetical protein [Candidatus Micrarchaeota archaeon]